MPELSQNSDGNLVELICKIPIKKGALVDGPQHPNKMKLGAEMTEAPRFLEIDKSLGLKLLAPLYGKCFSHVRAYRDYQ